MPSFTILCSATLLTVITAGTTLAQGSASFSTANSFDVLYHQGANSQYHVSGFPEPLGISPPRGCNVTRAAYVVRHCPITPSSFDSSSAIEPFLQKLGNASVDWESTDDLAFLATYTRLPLSVGLSMPTERGLDEARQLGASFAQRVARSDDGMGQLRNPTEIWASSANRTVESARAFAEGFTGGRNATVLQSIYEGEEDGADSLTPYESCNAYSGSSGSEQSTTFREQYTAPIAARFNAQMAAVNGTLTNGTAFNFTQSDIFGMQLLCGYEYNVRGSSPFCSTELFSTAEWTQFEYAQDLMYFYNSVGYGAPDGLAGSIGMPWVNASVDLLFADESEQDAYFSFVHREVPPTVYVALGLFNNSAFSPSDDINVTMPVDTVNPTRQWRSSTLLTYLTNVGIERLSCNAYGYTPGEYYRIVTSGTPQRLAGCTDGPGGVTCSRQGFKQWIEERQALFPAFSGACDVDYANSTDTLDIYNIPAVRF